MGWDEMIPLMDASEIPRPNNHRCLDVFKDWKTRCKFDRRTYLSKMENDRLEAEHHIFFLKGTWSEANLHFLGFHVEFSGGVCLYCPLTSRRIPVMRFLVFRVYFLGVQILSGCLDVYGVFNFALEVCNHQVFISCFTNQHVSSSKASKRIHHL